MGRNILLVGIGESGCSVAEKFSSNNDADMRVLSLAIDTDRRNLAELEAAAAFPMCNDSNLGAVVEAIGAENVVSWFPCDWDNDESGFLKGLDMSKGSNMWRLKALLSFASFLQSENDSAIEQKITDFVNECGYPCEIEIYVVASLSGGTGGGLFVPITYYLKNLIRKAGGDVVGTTAALTCPDIYENEFSREQRVKSYANAYAALRELHAINLVSRGYTRDTGVGKHAPTAFKIEIKGEEKTETIYDSDAELFKSPESAPFERVYLFERVPGVGTVDEHLMLVADSIKSLCLDAESGSGARNNDNLKMTDDVYGALTVTKVGYPVDSIVKYMSKRKLLCDVDSEWLCLHRKAMSEVRRKRGEARAYGFRFEESTEDYAKIALDAAEILTSACGSELAILGREKNDALLEGLPNKILDSGCMAQLKKIFEKDFLDENAEIIEEIISGAATKIPDAKGLHLFDSIKRKKLIITAAKKFDVALTDCYDNTIENIGKNFDKLEKQLLSESGEDGYSFITSLVMEKENFLHPGYALARLCSAYCDISKAVDKKFVIGNEEAIASYYSIPESVYKLCDNASIKCRYAKAGADRFEKLVTSQKPPVCGSEDDEAQFVEDAKLMSDRLFNVLESNFYARVLNILGRLIESYKEFLDIAERITDELEADVKTASLVDTADSGLMVNVASSYADRCHAYVNYAEDVANDAAAILERDKQTGKAVAALVLQKLGSVDRAAVRNTIREIGESYETDVKKSEFFLTHMDKNILEVLLSPDPKAVHDVSSAAKALRLSRAFCQRATPLRMAAVEDASEYRKIKTRTTVLLPDAVRAYAENATSSKDPSKLIAPLLSQVGEGSGEVAYRSDLPQRFLYVKREMTNVQLQFIEALNESGDNPLAYKSYIRSFENMKEQATQMWNPHLFRCTCEGSSRLPYVSPTKQSYYDCYIAKALLYAILFEEITVGEDPNCDGYVFRYMENDAEHTAYGDGDPISIERPEELYVWLSGKGELTERWARVFDRMVDDCKKELKCLSGGAPIMVEKAIREMGLVSLLKEKLLSFAYFYKNGRKTPALAQKMAWVGYQALMDICSCRLKDEFDFIEVYDSQLEAFMNSFIENGGVTNVDDLKEYFAWLNSFGAFIRRKPLGKSCDYEISPEQVETLG